jgi:hypothetical protein
VSTRAVPQRANHGTNRASSVNVEVEKRRLDIEGALQHMRVERAAELGTPHSEGVADEPLEDQGLVVAPWEPERCRSESAAGQRALRARNA